MTFSETLLKSMYVAFFAIAMLVVATFVVAIWGYYENVDDCQKQPNEHLVIECINKMRDNILKLKASNE